MARRSLCAFALRLPRSLYYDIYFMTGRVAIASRAAPTYVGIFDFLRVDLLFALLFVEHVCTGMYLHTVDLNIYLMTLN